ncbi:MAG: DCC1-like thiol-disulfide oxidoreductase family protein [Aestuariivirga sp.]
MQKQTKPILLYDGECGVCRRIAHWVDKSARNKSGEMSIILMPIGDDPEALKLINPSLNIWDAYATNYLIMPDASMKTGGEAVAAVFQILPNTKWFAWCFALSIFGFRPFQMMLNFAYAILDDIRPIFGCESCGTPSFWVRPIAAVGKWVSSVFGQRGGKASTAKFNSRHASPRRRMPSKPVISSERK